MNTKLARAISGARIDLTIHDVIEDPLDKYRDDLASDKLTATERVQAESVLLRIERTSTSDRVDAFYFAMQVAIAGRKISTAMQPAMRSLREAVKCINYTKLLAQERVNAATAAREITSKPRPLSLGSGQVRPPFGGRLCTELHGRVVVGIDFATCNPEYPKQRKRPQRQSRERRSARLSAARVTHSVFRARCARSRS